MKKGVWNSETISRIQRHYLEVKNSIWNSERVSGVVPREGRAAEESQQNGNGAGEEAGALTYTHLTLPPRLLL